MTIVKNNSVQIETNGILAWADRLVEHYLSPLLVTGSNEFEPAGPLGYRRRRVSRRFINSVAHGQVCFPSWVLPQLIQKLKQVGHEVVVRDLWQEVPRPATDESLRSRLSESENRLLDALLSGPRGLIEYRKSAEQLRAIELICRYFSPLRIVIAAATRRQVRNIHRTLSRRLNGRIKTSEEWNWDKEDRLLVISLNLLDHCNVDDWDVVILANAVEALVKSHLSAFQTFERRRLFGLLPATSRIGRHRRNHLHFFCGPVIHRMPTCLRPDFVRVHWCQPPWTPPVARWTGLERKRLAYWHNDARNGFIADVAGALVANDLEEMWRLGLFLDKDGNDAARDGQPPAVAILVESTEHGRALLRRLPGWRLWDRSADRHDQPQPASDSTELPERLDKVILTLVRASSLSAIATDVLIYAGGGEWPSNLPVMVSRSPQGRSDPLVVDFADDFDAVAAEATRRRWQAYLARAWAVEGTPRWMLADEDDGPWDAPRRARKHRKGIAF